MRRLFSSLIVALLFCILCVIGLDIARSQEIAVGHYTFDNGGEDSSGNAFHGILLGGGEIVATEGQGGAFSLNGIDAEFKVAPPDPRFFPREAITVSLWVKLDEAPLKSSDIFQFVSGGLSQVSLSLIKNEKTGSNFLEFLITNEKGQFKQISDPAFPLAVGRWHHIVATYNVKTGAQVYLDGFPRGSVAVPGGGLILWGNTFDALRVGGKTDDLMGVLHGHVDEFQIYDRAFADVVVASIYETGVLALDAGQTAIESGTGGETTVTTETEATTATTTTDQGTSTTTEATTAATTTDQQTTATEEATTTTTPPPPQEQEEGLKTIAQLEGEMRTFESYADNAGTLLVWGSYNKLYAARIDPSGNVLIPAKTIASSENHITGISKPIPWKGGWLIAMRETQALNIDWLRLIHLDAAGGIVKDLLWLKDYKRISLPVFLEYGLNRKVFYFASSDQTAGLYQALLEDLEKLGERKLVQSFEGEVLYPPIVQGLIHDNAYALLIYHRSKKPPPMELLSVDKNKDAVLKRSEIAHDGDALRISEPVFENVNGELRVVWHEAITKAALTRLVIATFGEGGSASKKMIPFESSTLPNRHRTWENESMLGVSSRPVYLENKPAFLHTEVVSGADSPFLRRSFIKPQLPEKHNIFSLSLLKLDKLRRSGLLVLNGKLVHSPYLETEKKERRLTKDPEIPFKNFRECVGADESRKECSEKARGDWYMKEVLKLHEEKSL